MRYQCTPLKIVGSAVDFPGITLINFHIVLHQIWPEVTDPAKFVYEDVAIATYLLVIHANCMSSICSRPSLLAIDIVGK